MSSHASHSLPDALCRLTGRDHALITGRGATALYLALRAAGLQGERVILPANICPAAVCPVLYSGNVPVFCDIDLTDFNSNLTSLRAALSRGAAAVIAPHSYGHAAPIGEIALACREAGALLIEDAAPALGAMPDGRPAGSHGDCSVLSFGRAKIIDAGGGGALVTDDLALFGEAQRLLATLPEWTGALQRRAADMVHLVRGWWNARRTEPGLDALLRPVWELYRDVHLSRPAPGQEERIVSGLQHLEGIVAERQANCDEYQRLLDGAPVRRPEPRPGSICWRYTFLVAAPLRDGLVDTLRGAGLDVSTLYPAAHRQFGTPTEGALPNCDELERGVVNLWVAPPLAPPDVRRNAETLLAALEQVEADGAYP